MSPASHRSTGEPHPTYPMSPSPIPTRPYHSDLGEVVHIPPSLSSSSGSSTDTYRRDGSLCDSRMADSRVGDLRRGGESYGSPTSQSETNFCKLLVRGSHSIPSIGTGTGTGTGSY